MAVGVVCRERQLCELLLLRSQKIREKRAKPLGYRTAGVTKEGTRSREEGEGPWNNSGKPQQLSVYEVQRRGVQVQKKGDGWLCVAVQRDGHGSFLPLHMVPFPV